MHSSTVAASDKPPRLPADHTGRAAVAVAALHGSTRRRPSTAAAQPLIAQFAQMAPRKPGAARRAVLDLTSDVSDDDFGAAAAAAPACLPPPASAQLWGNTGTQPQAGGATRRSLGSAHVLEEDVQPTCVAAVGPAGGGAGGTSGHARHGGASGAGSGRGYGAQQGAEAGSRHSSRKRRRLEEGAAPAEEVSSDGAGVVVVDDVEAVDAVSESAEDAERRRRRALCAAAAERRHVDAAAAEGASVQFEGDGPL